MYDEAVGESCSFALLQRLPSGEYSAHIKYLMQTYTMSCPIVYSKLKNYELKSLTIVDGIF
jgi:hypothetical protein